MKYNIYFKRGHCLLLGPYSLNRHAQLLNSHQLNKLKHDNITKCIFKCKCNVPCTRLDRVETNGNDILNKFKAKAHELFHIVHSGHWILILMV